jgi:DNA gyrase inhibitor GyrI
MTSTNVQLTRLEPMRIASAYGFGTNPEELAWRTMVTWAKPRGLLEDLTLHPIFGLNNPYPSPTSPKYGYEFWIRIGPELEPVGEIRIGEFLGGPYAVCRCEVNGHPETAIPAGWKLLADWCRDNNHALGYHHDLEKFLTNPDDVDHLIMELCCPIRSC